MLLAPSPPKKNVAIVHMKQARELLSYGRMQFGVPTETANMWSFVHFWSLVEMDVTIVCRMYRV